MFADAGCLALLQCLAMLWMFDDALDVRLRMFAMFWMLADALDPKIMR